MDECGVGFSSEHAGDFVFALGVDGFHKRGRRAVAGGVFDDDKMRAGGGGDLGEVGDAKDLMRGTELFHFRADFCADFAADVGVDLVENENGNTVLRGERGFECEHDAGDFAAGRDGPKRTFRLAGIRGKKKLNLLATVRARLGERLEGERESGPRESEVGEMFFYKLGEGGSGRCARVGELVRGFF